MEKLTTPESAWKNLQSVQAVSSSVYSELTTLVQKVKKVLEDNNRSVVVVKSKKLVSTNGACSKLKSFNCIHPVENFQPLLRI